MNYYILEKETKRLKAIKLRKEGLKFKDIAYELGCSLKSVYNWQRAYREKGDEFYKEKSHNTAKYRKKKRSYHE